MNGSVDTAKMAGMESSAKTRSENSMITSTTSSGVACSRPFLRTTKCPPS